MGKLGLYFFLLLLSFGVKAQQTVQYSQFVLNQFAYNPALAGTKECIDVKLGYRTQWVGLDGAPRSAFGSFHSKLKFKKRSDPRRTHGIGFLVESDAIGPLSRTTVNLAYAYHFPVARDVKASIGVFAGFQQFKVDVNKMRLGNGNDPAINGSGARFFIPYVAPGLFLSHKNWFAGYSIKQIVRNKWKILGTDISRNRFHHNVVFGKRFKTSNDINLVPSAMLKVTGYSAPAFDLNLMAELNPSFEIGGSWRNGDAIIGMVKFKFLSYFTLGYSFDFTTSRMRYGSSNTHEIIFGISGCAQDASTYDCPAF